MIKKGKNYIMWFKSYEKNDKITKKYINDWDVINDFFFLFSAYNRKLYLNICGFTKVKIGNFIPTKDIEYMVINSKNNNKLISYFLSKLNE